MDAYHRERFAAIYRLLADVLDHGSAAPSESGHLSYLLGDLTRRVFVGPRVDPPDEMLEQVAQLLRASDPNQFPAMAKRLRAHAEVLEQLPDAGPPAPEPDEPGPSVPD